MSHNIYNLCMCVCAVVGMRGSFVSCIHFRILCFLFHLSYLFCAAVLFGSRFRSFSFVRLLTHAFLSIHSLSNCIQSERKQSRKLLLYSHLWHIIDSLECSVRTLLIRKKNMKCHVVVDITWLCATENKAISE